MTNIPPVDEHPIEQTISEPLQQLLKSKANSLRDRQANGRSSDHPEQAARFRPLRRPPVALLTILDDGSDTDGETVRIRTTKFTLGRAGCDVNIPFDPDLSGVHATLECVHRRGEYRWYLCDQDSTNGTFLRAYKARPRHGAELMIGSRRYDFRTSTSVNNPVKADPEQTITFVKPSPTKPGLHRRDWLKSPAPIVPEPSCRSPKTSIRSGRPPAVTHGFRTIRWFPPCMRFSQENCTIAGCWKIRKVPTGFGFESTALPWLIRLNSSWASSVLYSRCDKHVES